MSDQSQQSQITRLSLERDIKPVEMSPLEKRKEASSFGLFLNWIYYQTMRNEEGLLPGLVDLAKLWALGERFQIAALQNAAMDHIRKEVQYPSDFEAFIHFAYQVEGQRAELRKLAIARLAWTLPGRFEEILGRLPGAAQMDLIMELKSQRDAVPKDQWREIGDTKEFYVAEKLHAKEV